MPRARRFWTASGGCCEGGWELRQLGDALKLEYGKPLPEEDRDDDGAYPAYGANGVKCRTKMFFFGKPSIIVGRKRVSR